MTLQTDGNAPYAPPSTVIEVIRRYRDRGMQTPFNADVLARAGVPESLGPRTLQALRLLELTTEAGHPTEALESLAKAPTEEEYRERFAGLIRGVYGEVFSYVDPANEPTDRVRAAFRSYVPRGQQERMVRLFLGLCVEAGLIPEEAATVRAQPNGTPRRETARRERQRHPQSTRRGSGSATATLASGLPPAIGGLIAELAEIGPTWNTEQRDRFLSAFRSMVDYSYPVHTMPPAPDSDEVED